MGEVCLGDATRKAKIAKVKIKGGAKTVPRETIHNENFICQERGSECRRD